MKRNLALVALAVLLSATLVRQTAQAASTSADATATIVSTIGISKTNDLRFGNVAAGSSIGTVVQSPTGTRTKTGGVTLSNVNAGGPASFTVSGDGSASFAITLPGSAVTLSDGGTNTMTVDTFTSNPSGSGTLSGGSQSVAVGATLHVGANQPAGAYTGTFSVSVDYN